MKRAKIQDFFLLSSNFFLRDVSSLVLSDGEERKKKLGRVVSLNIDLQGISELDRDVVIASHGEGKKIVYVQRCSAKLCQSCSRKCAVSSFEGLAQN